MVKSTTTTYHCVYRGNAVNSKATVHSALRLLLYLDYGISISRFLKNQASGTGNITYGALEKNGNGVANDPTVIFFTQVKKNWTFICIRYQTKTHSSIVLVASRRECQIALFRFGHG